MRSETVAAPAAAFDSSWNAQLHGALDRRRLEMGEAKAEQVTVPSQHLALLLSIRHGVAAFKRQEQKNWH